MKNLFKAIIIATSSLVISSCGGADQTTGQVSSKEGQVDAIFKEWDNKDSPGCLAFAFQDGEMILNKSYGMADLEWEQPIDENTVFYIASTTKQFAAASLALLILDGKVSLEDDIKDYFPELPDFGTLIRVKNLVFHTFGHE